MQLVQGGVCVKTVHQPTRQFGAIRGVQIFSAQNLGCAAAALVRHVQAAGGISAECRNDFHSAAGARPAFFKQGRGMQCHHWAATDGNHQCNHPLNTKQGARGKAGIHETAEHREMHQLVRQARHALQ